MGVLLAVHGVSQAAALDVLREVSRRTDIDLRAVAEAVLAQASGHPLPEPVGPELDAAVRRRKAGDAPEEPG
ncbi:ANTAR domain-containing protein [Streptomyces sp. NBC_00267]|uniref:ANTAR domain-containing protein n=1 Tax=unclassified Streptomyces TaxID=2593676 RepID=UPI003FA722D9